MPLNPKHYSFRAYIIDFAFEGSGFFRVEGLGFEGVMTAASPGRPSPLSPRVVDRSMVALHARIHLVDMTRDVV